MICFDTNIVVYIANKRLSEAIIDATPIGYASVVSIEALGYSKLSRAEEVRIKQLLATFSKMDLSQAIIERAIILRQLKKMSLGDAIIAATALENDATLWTANSDDFAHIDELKLHNPLL